MARLKFLNDLNVKRPANSHQSYQLQEANSLDSVSAESAPTRLLSTVIPNYLVSNFSLIRAALPDSSRKW